MLADLLGLIPTFVNYFEEPSMEQGQCDLAMLLAAMHWDEQISYGLCSVLYTCIL